MYLLFGPEGYQRSLAAKTIADKALQGSELREFNESEFSLAEVSLLDALAPAEQLPMLATRRVIRITELSKLKESDEEALSAYLARPAETSVVVFVADEIDKRRRYAKALFDAAVAVEFKPLSDTELTDWARTSFRDQGVVIDGKALGDLILLVGNDLQRLTNEIDKLVTAALPDKVIPHELVSALVPNSREISNFDLPDHIIAQRSEAAIRTLKKILDDGGEPLMLLGLLGQNFRRLYLAKELMKQGAERSDVARVAGVPPFKQEEFLRTARKIESERLAFGIKRIAEADLAIKTSQATPRLQIEMLVMELTA